MVFNDLTDHISPCYAHYKSLDVEFDVIYSGFLASAKQIDGCLEFFRGYPNALKVVDPVMGDNGKPYKTYTPELCERMGELVSIADIITPNLTEAVILLGENYSPIFDTKVLSDRLHCLSKRLGGAGDVVITGAHTEYENYCCNIGFSRRQGELCCVEYEHLPVHYPGTGDIFTSVFIGELLRLGETNGGGDFETAIKRATSFAQKAVEVTYANSGVCRNGVMFEPLLRELM